MLTSMWRNNKARSDGKSTHITIFNLQDTEWAPNVLFMTPLSPQINLGNRKLRYWTKYIQDSRLLYTNCYCFDLKFSPHCETACFILSL
jgi:hypothetical protein